LCASCPHHQISEQLLLQYFYEGLSNIERSIIDAASGGALGDMTPIEAWNLIEKMASNSQQFRARNDAIVLRGVHDVATNSSSSVENKKLEGKLDALVNLVTQLAINHKFASALITVAMCVVYVLLLITIQISILLCSNLKSMSNLKPMLQTFIIDPISSKTNNSRIIMIFQTTDTIQVGGII